MQTHRRNTDKGAALVESALILPIALLMLMPVAELAC